MTPSFGAEGGRGFAPAPQDLSLLRLPENRQDGCILQIWQISGQGASIDTTRPAGKLVFGILAALAEFERELISERTKVGLIFVRARSRKGGDWYKMTAAKLQLAMASMGKTAAHGRQPMP